MFEKFPKICFVSNGTNLSIRQRAAIRRIFSCHLNFDFPLGSVPAHTHRYTHRHSKAAVVHSDNNDRSSRRLCIFTPGYQHKEAAFLLLENLSSDWSETHTHTRTVSGPFIPLCTWTVTPPAPSGTAINMPNRLVCYCCTWGGQGQPGRSTKNVSEVKEGGALLILLKLVAWQVWNVFLPFFFFFFYYASVFGGCHCCQGSVEAYWLLAQESLIVTT